MTLPNLLTFGRIALIPLIILLLYAQENLPAAVLFLISSLLDALDGYYARRLNAVTDFGKFMDPIADKILVLSTLIVLVEIGSAPAVPVVLIAAREIFISGWRSHKAAKGVVVQAGVAGKIKTILQLLAVLMIIVKLPYGNSVLWLAAFISLYSGVEYIGRN